MRNPCVCPDGFVPSPTIDPESLIAVGDWRFQPESGINPALQIGHRPAAVQKTVVDAGNGRLGGTHHLPAVVDVLGIAGPTAEGAEVGHRAVVVAESA